MGLIRMPSGKQAGREKPCNSQSIFTASDGRDEGEARPRRLQAAKGGGKKEKWGHDLWQGSSARQPARSQQREPARRGGGGGQSNLPDSDRMRGWSDDAPPRQSTVIARRAPQRAAAPARTLGVRKTIQKKRAGPMGSSFPGQRDRRAALVPASTQVAFQEEVGGDEAYSATGLYGPLHARQQSQSWQGGKGGKGGKSGKGRFGIRGSFGKGKKGGGKGGKSFKGGGRGGKWGSGRKGKGRGGKGKGKW